MKTLLVVLMMSTFSAFSQTRSISGRVIDEQKTAIPYANLILTDNFACRYLMRSGFDGEFNFTGLKPGTYNLELFTLGMDTSKITNIKLYDNVNLDSIVLFKNDFIDKYIGGCGWPTPIYKDNDIKKPFKKEIIGPNDFARSPLRQLLGDGKPEIILISEYQEAQMVQGLRTGDVTIYIDGVKIIGSTEIPKSSFHRAEIYYGGIPSKYGDTTGGIVLIETKSYFDLYYEWMMKR